MPAAEPAGLKVSIKAALRKIGSFQAGIILTILYYLALGPAALLARLMGRDGLGLRGGATGWTKREPVDAAEHLRSQG